MPSSPDVFTKNLELLKLHHPHVYTTLTRDSYATIGQIFSTGTDRLNLNVSTPDGRHLYLHDRENPENDIKPFLSLVSPGSTGVAVLFGMGLGYAALSLLEERPTLHFLAIFEHDSGIFSQALKNVDLSELLSSPKVLLSVGAEPDLGILDTATRALSLENIYTLRHLPSYTAQPHYHSLEAKVFEHISEFNVEGGTNIHFGKVFLNNRFSHLSAIHHQHLIDSLENAFENIPAILVAGGPSLDKNIHLLKKTKGKAVILGVDSVLPALSKATILPDFLTSVDPQELTYEKLANTPLNELSIPLICMSWVSPKVPKTFPASSVFWTFSAKPFEQWINSLLGGSILTGGAGTVAHLNMLAAIIMGCSPIILIGQDLSFTPNRSSHTSNAFLTHDNKAHLHLEASDHLFTAPAWGGGQIQTTRDFFGMKRFFERMITDNPRVYINATEGGVHIEGAEDIPLQAAIAEYCQTPLDIPDVIKERCARSKPNIEKLLGEFEQVKKTTGSLLELIAKTDRTTVAAKRELAVLAKKRRAPETFSQLPPALRKKIKEIETAHNTLDSHTQLWQALEEITLEGLRDSERLRHEIIPLANNPATYLKWLHKNLKRCENINKTRIETLSYFENQLSRVLAHHEKERQMLQAMKREGETPSLLSSLASLYMESEDLTLAAPILDRLATLSPTAETSFNRGVIALERAEYERGNRYLDEAMHLDPDYTPRVASFRRMLGDRYLKHAMFYRGLSIPTMRRLLLKGLRYCPDHPELISNLITLCRQDLQKATEALQESNWQDLLTLTAPWLAELEAHAELCRTLGHDDLSILHHLHGQALAAQGNYSAAIDHLRKATALAPHRAELHIQLMNLLFHQEQFGEGIEHLQKAVAIDRTHASHWEEIGDNLARSGMPQEALSAYEQCFMALPENPALLKKIGDCYMTLNQLPAAQAAYEKYKEALMT